MSGTAGGTAPRVLYLVHRVPYAPNRGDRIRSYHTLRVLRSAGISTHVIALAHDDEEQEQASRLSEIAESYDVLRVPEWRNRLRAAAALAGSTPLTHVLLDHPDIDALLRARVASFHPTAVLAYCSGMARFAMSPTLSSIPFVLDMVDLDSTKWHELASITTWPLRYVYEREARCLARFERAACERARLVLAINAREASEVRGVAKDATVEIMANGVDIDYFQSPSTHNRERQVIFTAVFDYPPNEVAARWAITQVWPRVVSRSPDARLILAGARPTKALRRAAARGTGITVTGALDDIRPHLWNSTVAIAPVTISRGTQNKVLEAVAAGLRCIVTPQVQRGLPAAVLGRCDVASTPQEFAEAISAALQRPADRVNDLAGLRWESTISALVDVIRGLAG